MATCAGLPGGVGPPDLRRSATPNGTDPDYLQQQLLLQACRPKSTVRRDSQAEILSRPPLAAVIRAA